jgi:hypothetical protein
MYYNYYQNLKNGGIFVNNCLFIKRLSFLLTLVILTNFLFVSYSEAKQNVDYDYIQKVLTEVDSIDKSLNSMHLSFEDILKSKPTNEKMNKAWANAYLTSIGEEGIILTTTPSQITLSPINKAPQTVKQTTESQIYAERLCYARKIAEINKKRDSNAKDLDSESVYMYISHYLDIPGGPLPLDMPVDYHSNNSLMSAWITNADRNVYERFLSFEMREKAKKAMGDFETYAQIAHKEQTLEALQQYDNNIKGLHEAMKGYNELYVAIAYVCFVDSYNQLATTDLDVVDIKITIPHDLANLVPYSGMKETWDFKNILPSDPKTLLDDVHEHFRTVLKIENKALRDMYIGAGLSMFGIVRYASSGEQLDTRIIKFARGSSFANYIMVDAANHTIFTSMLTNTLLMNKEFYSYVNWLVMASTAGSRAANRMWRYMMGM